MVSRTPANCWYIIAVSAVLITLTVPSFSQDPPPAEAQPAEAEPEALAQPANERDAAGEDGPKRGWLQGILDLKVNLNNDQFGVLVRAFWCLLLAGGYIRHIVYVRSIEIGIETQGENAEAYKAFKAEQDERFKWPFLLVTIVLPLVSSLVSTSVAQPVAAGAEPASWLRITTAFYLLAKAVFILMITVEISYWYNLDRQSTRHWRPPLTGALILDFLSLLIFLVIIRPPTPGMSNVFTAGFLLATACASFLSSYLTIYYTRVYQLFNANGNKAP